MRGLDQTGNREVNIRLETKGVMPEEKLEEIKKYDSDLHSKIKEQLFK